MRACHVPGQARCDLERGGSSMPLIAAPPRRKKVGKESETYSHAAPFSNRTALVPSVAALALAVKTSFGFRSDLGSSSGNRVRDCSWQA